MYLCKKKCTCRAIIYIYLLVIVLSYETRCPAFMERSILSQKCSSEEPFHCLKEDNSKTFIQGCRKWEWVANGSFPVLSGRYIYYKDCIPNTYQPYIYKSNEGYICSYTKSLCKEFGHVTLSNGTTVTNRLCGCDHTRGYSFVDGPTTGSCNSVLEDCSCYSKGCGLEQNLNHDFICGRKDKVDISVMERNTINVPLVNTHEETKSANLKQLSDFLYEYRKYIITALVVISLILSLVNCSVLFKMNTNEDTNKETIMAKQLTNTTAKYKQDPRLPIIQSTYEDIPKDQYNSTIDRPKSAQTIEPQPVIEDKTNTYTVPSKLTDNVQMRSLGSVEDKYHSTIAGLESTQRIKTQPVIEVNTSKTYTVPSKFIDNVQMKSSGSVEDQYKSTKDRPKSTQTIEPQPVIEDKTNFADILILDLEYPPDKAKVIEFKDHLRTLVPELCFRDNIQIRLFEEINIHTASTKQIMLTELFNRCKYLFVYISKSHIPSKALQKGLSEKDLVSAMKKSECGNIITVLDCSESWDIPDQYRTDLNYFNYKQSINCEAYTSFLRGLFQTLR